MKIVVACLVVLCFVGVVAAEEYSVSVQNLTVLGQSCAVIKTVRKGGPLSGFLGNTQINQTTVVLGKDGNLQTLSSSNNNNAGLGDKVISGTIPMATLGAFYAVGEAIRVPDTTRVSQGQVGVNQPSVKTSTSTATTTATSSVNQNVNTNINNLRQDQNQIQLQRQRQFQELF